MTFENFLNWTVSIDCGSALGIYQGQIKSVDGIQQTLTLKYAFHNGVLLDEDGQHPVIIPARYIQDLSLLAEPGTPFQVPKTINKRSSNDDAQQQSKPASIATNGASHKAASSSSRMTPHQSSRSRSSKSWSDEPPNESSPQTLVPSTLSNRLNHFDFDASIVSTINNNKLTSSSSSSSTTTTTTTNQAPQQLQDKYRCDQMILEHNNGPIEYEQIVLPVSATKKYHTDEGLVIPAISSDLRVRLFASADNHGYSIERRIEAMGHCTADMCLHLMGGTQRLLVKNRHQRPTLVVLACWSEVQGGYAICAGRILASRNIRVYLYMPPPPLPSHHHLCIENELKLFRTTGGVITHNVADLPRAPVDMILNGLDGANNSDPVLFAKPWYRDIVQYCSRLQASVIGVDPPVDGGAIECKYSLVPVLPSLAMSSRNVGRLYLCDLGFGQKVFEHLQIRYASPFGAKSFVALHDN